MISESRINPGVEKSRVLPVVLHKYPVHRAYHAFRILQFLFTLIELVIRVAVIRILKTAIARGKRSVSRNLMALTANSSPGNLRHAAAGSSDVRDIASVCKDGRQVCLLFIFGIGHSMDTTGISANQ